MAKLFYGWFAVNYVLLIIFIYHHINECCWLDSIHPASLMHRVTRWHQVCLSWADASTSSQVNPIRWRSLFTITMSLQLILGLPGLLLNPATSHCSACFRMRTSSILVTWPSPQSFSDHLLEKCLSCYFLYLLIRDFIPPRDTKNASQPSVVGCFQFLTVSLTLT